MTRYNFDPGDAPLATEWQRDLGDQVIFHLANATARDADIPSSPTDKRKEGMMAAILDINEFQVFNGTNWVSWARWGDWNNVTNLALTATTTNPTEGTGATRLARWMRMGTTVFLHIFWKFGSSGAAVGSGTYELQIPTGAEPAPEIYGTEELVAGNGIAVIGSTPYTVFPKVIDDNSIRLVSPGVTADVTHANLGGGWTPGGDVVFNGTLVYEGA